MINKLDRERSSFERTLENVQSVFGRTAFRSNLPIGAEREFKGIVDLIRMKAYTYTPDGDGKGKESEIPANLAEAAQKAHEALIEMVAEGNDKLLEEFFEKGTLPTDEIIEGLRDAVRQMRIYPVFVRLGLAQHRDRFAVEFHPGGFSRAAHQGPWKGTLNGKEVERPFKDSEPVSAFVFKTVADPFAGRVSYFKVISGVVKNDANLVHVRSGGAERLAHIGVLAGKTIQAGARTACGRYRRGRQAEGNADRRHAGRQSFADRLSAW